MKFRPVEILFSSTNQGSFRLKGNFDNCNLGTNMFLIVHKRFEIVFLSKHTYGPHSGIKKIAAIVKCSTRTVKKWVKR